MFLSVVASFLGVGMALCVPWGAEAAGGDWRWEARGVEGLLKGAATSFAVSIAFFWAGRGADSTRLFRKEAIAIVAFGWILAIFLGATPYIWGGAELRPGVPATFVDAIFESASGLTTTGATVFGELENPASLPRTLLFWRFATHFIGGLGVMCFFVALIGHGANGKAIMKLERGASGNAPFAKMRALAFSLFLIYVSLNVACALLFWSCGVTIFDAIAHAFSTVATGGFSSRNAGVGAFADDPNVNGVAFEIVTIIFMIVSSTNYGLLYWVAIGRPGKLARDSEWRAYLAILTAATVFVFATGWANGDFRRDDGEAEVVAKSTVAATEIPTPNEVANGEIATRGGAAVGDGKETKGAATVAAACFGELTAKEALALNAENGENRESGGIGEGDASWADALRDSAFAVVSLASGAGFATAQYEFWNPTALFVLALVMFWGGCSASTAGGAKIYRFVLVGKALARAAELTRSPNVVRATRYNGEILEKETLNAVSIYLISLLSLICATTFATLLLEPDAPWADAAAPRIEKLTDLAGAALSMFSNVGPAFGKMGAFENYGFLSAPTKFLYACATLTGRLEIWVVLAIFAPGFWRRG